MQAAYNVQYKNVVISNETKWSEESPGSKGYSIFHIQTRKTFCMKILPVNHLFSLIRVFVLKPAGAGIL